MNNGPDMWRELHLECARSTMNAYRMQQFTAHVPNGTCKCRDHWMLVLAQMPPPYKTVDLFAWSVRAHNKINRMLGKPEMSVEDATLLYV